MNKLLRSRLWSHPHVLRGLSIGEMWDEMDVIKRAHPEDWNEFLLWQHDTELNTWSYEPLLG